jgi:hypothetical protein
MRGGPKDGILHSWASGGSSGHLPCVRAFGPIRLAPDEVRGPGRRRGLRRSFVRSGRRDRLWIAHMFREDFGLRVSGSRHRPRRAAARARRCAFRLQRHHGFSICDSVGDEGAGTGSDPPTGGEWWMNGWIGESHGVCAFHAAQFNQPNAMGLAAVGDAGNAPGCDHRVQRMPW